MSFWTDMQCFHKFWVSLCVYTVHLFMFFCASVGGQSDREIWIDVSIWRQVFREWVRAAAASDRSGLLPLWVQLHHWLWLLAVIGVWNLNMLFHYSKFGLCWRVGNHRVFGFMMFSWSWISVLRFIIAECVVFREMDGNVQNRDHIHICNWLLLFF